MEEDLVALILSIATVSDACGDRVTPTWRKQGSPLPATTATVIGRTPGYHTTGADGLDQYRVQVDVWAKTYAEAKTVARAIVARLGGFSGVAGTTRFDGIFLTDERDLPELDQPERLDRVSLDFNVWAASAA